MEISSGKVFEQQNIHKANMAIPIMKIFCAQHPKKRLPRIGLSLQVI